MKLLFAAALLMSSRGFASGIEVRAGDPKSTHSVQVPGEKLKIPLGEKAIATGKDFGDFAPVQNGARSVIRVWLLPTGLQKLQTATNDTRDDVLADWNLPGDVQAAKQHETPVDAHWVCLMIDGDAKDCRPISKLSDDFKMDSKKQPILIRRGFEIPGFKSLDEAAKYAKKLFDMRAAEFKPTKKKH